MRRMLIVAGVTLVCVWGVSAQPTENELVDWAVRHWGAIGSGDAAAVVGWFTSDGAVAFLGTPWDGFYHGDAVRTTWEAFFANVLVGAHSLVGKVRVLDRGGLVHGTMQLMVRGGTLVVDSVLRFDVNGKVVAADLIVTEGLGLLAPVVDGGITDGEYPHSVRDEQSGVEFAWRNGLTVLFGALRSPGTGWVSAGFGPDRGMEGANYILAAVSPSGLTIEDHYGTGFTSHRRDDQDDILRAAGAVTEGKTVVEFMIPLASGDPEDKDLRPGQTYAVLLAYHRTSVAFTVRHTARGSVMVALDG